MCSQWASRESQRLSLQTALDQGRTLLDRNRWGQFATPPRLASEIVRYALQLHDANRISFMEPSCGTGSFFSALVRHIGDKRLDQAVGVELDNRFARAASDLWADFGLEVHEADFTSPETISNCAASLLVANPPYVRHHHLTASKKRELSFLCESRTGIRPSGLSGLYLYFVLLSHKLLAPGAVSAWLIPSEFMDVNYGTALKEYLTRQVSLVRVHRYDASEVQFDDALVTSTVVVFRNTLPDPTCSAEFSFGGSLTVPRVSHQLSVSDLQATSKWSQHAKGAITGERSGPTLSDFFRIRRGLATGSNNFFIMPRQDAEMLGIQRRFLRPILPSPRKLKVDTISAKDSGWPMLPEQLALIDCPLPLEQLREEDPQLAKYLETADEKVMGGYLVSKRSPWYKQEQREAAPILLTYMGRGKDEKHPLRFIRNDSKAVATNMYLMLYPIGPLKEYLAKSPSSIQQVHSALLALTADDLRGGGRVYGGGLHKMEPKELAALPADTIAALDPTLLTAERTPSEYLEARPIRHSKASGATTAEIRAWARLQGFEVPARGRLGSNVIAAWHEAHSALNETASGLDCKEPPQTLW
ncbi:Lsr2 family protein [Streptomyces sp. JJ66]|uniref:Lsr2 family DNA-binding protein n=1 Tax=Streptomyces sp. JJ66 TaxID=2803843 RepID=UPI001C565DFE|nr:histone-like nucleoid-structuring protein Lsr2 [Streptomyces sp. JJ66]MBW1601428.1 Lsr2 family protein [Streptomyces sp. JJ66]